jgi:hypothetical protein
MASTPTRPAFGHRDFIARFGDAGRTRQATQLLAMADQLDAHTDGSGHALRRSLCLSLPLHADAFDAARALVRNALLRPAAERLELCGLLEDLLITGFDGAAALTPLQRSRLHAAQRILRPSSSSLRNPAS